MLIVQRIRTEWTKASRGGRGATARNATPAALRLPPMTGPLPGALFHDVRCLERDDFVCRASSAALDAGPRIRIEPLYLHVTGETVATRFVWSWHHCGAPERESHELFRLSPGEWGRFTCNGRFGAESSSGREWGYHKTVFNVAFAVEPDENQFLQTEPVADVSELAALK